jgi:hypothetical protein
MIKRKAAYRYERITGTHGAGKHGRYAVAIAPGRHVRCFVKVDATALKDYTLVDIDARTDIISFPVQ